MKEGSVYHVTKVLTDNTKRKQFKGVMKEQYITVGLKATHPSVRLMLRRITFKTETGKIYVFNTNNFTLPALEIATIYKNRWMIEILFKQIKQNFPLRYFWGQSKNASLQIPIGHGEKQRIQDLLLAPNNSPFLTTTS